MPIIGYTFDVHAQAFEWPRKTLDTKELIRIDHQKIETTLLNKLALDYAETPFVLIRDKKYKAAVIMILIS
jgi:hypothetical protein